MTIRGSRFSEQRIGPILANTSPNHCPPGAGKQGTPQQINAVLNWFEELKQRAPTQ